jgi:hypothetical protein
MTHTQASSLVVAFTNALKSYTTSNAGANEAQGAESGHEGGGGGGMLEDVKREQGLLNVFTKEFSPLPSKSRGEGEGLGDWDADADTAENNVNGSPGERTVMGRAQILKSTLQ